MDFSPAYEHELLRQTVRDFFASELPPDRVRELDESGTLPRELWRRLGELGWLGLPIPEAYGGVGADVVTAAVLVEELARGFASLASDFVLLSMASRQLLELGSETHREELLPKLATGEIVVALGMTEPGGGTDVLQLKTRAQLENGSWIINGQKVFTSRAVEADYIVVLARTDAPEPDHRARGLSLILTSRNQEGIEARHLKLISMRAAGTSEVFFDNARAPADGLLGRRGRGYHHLISALNNERILGGSIWLGIGAAAFDEALRYAKERNAFGRPIGSFQSLQHYLADTAVELEGARLLLSKAAWLQSQNSECSLESAMAKAAAGEAAIRATDRAMRIFAGHGVAQGSPVERCFRDARVGAFSPLSNEMARNIIGERLGLPKSY